MEFSSWFVAKFDQNDTVREPGNAWYRRNSADNATPEAQRAAQLAADHADTPHVTHLDFNNAQVDARNRYTYDALYRLVEARGREHAGQIVTNTFDNWSDCPFRKKYQATDAMAWRNYTEQYVYDQVGNILTVKHVAQGDSSSSWTRNYQYSRTSNRLLATGMGSADIDHYPHVPGLEYRYEYNSHGSMTNMPHLSGMDWDFAEHLHHISRAPDSRIYEGDCPEGSLVAWYRYDSGKERTRKRVVKNGGIVKERDEETGLNYHGARYYATWLSRWCSCDPIGIEDEHNVYKYARNHPVIFIDSAGTEAKRNLPYKVTNDSLLESFMKGVQNLSSKITEIAHVAHLAHAPGELFHLSEESKKAIGHIESIILNDKNRIKGAEMAIWSRTSAPPLEIKPQESLIPDFPRI